MTKLIAFALGSSLAFSALAADAPAPNATFLEGKGRVLVNQGEEFKPAVKGMRLKPGDRIMVQDDGEAKIKFDDDCEYEVEENKISTMPDRSPCAGGSPVVQEMNPAGGNAIGGGATGSGNGGVWTMAAIVAAIDIWWLNEDDHDIVSP
jgi:hypothetical protein